MSILPDMIFFFVLVVLGYALVGYPFVLAILALFSGNRSIRTVEHLPKLSVLIAVHNEQDTVSDRIANILETSYPGDLLEVVVVSDGSTDKTVEVVRELENSRVILLPNPARHGKPYCINQGVSRATGHIVVLTDSRQVFDPETIPRLAKHFSDPKVGAVSGSLSIAPSTVSAGAGLGLYWRIEKQIRRNESRIDSCIGCTGAVYALRRNLYEPVPEDTLLDDVVIPMQVALKGYRVLFDPEAVAFDPQPLDPDKEDIRKRRTIAGNFQMLFRYPHWLLPWKNRLALQLISHKYLRLLLPLLSFGVFVSNIFLALDGNGFYSTFLVLQCILYTAGIAGVRLKRGASWLLSAPAGFLFLNWMVLRGLHYYLAHRESVGWEPSRS